MVRGLTMVTSSPCAAASRQAHSAASLAWPYASTGMGMVVDSTGFEAGMPNTALDDVCTTLCTPARLAWSNSNVVPSTFTLRSNW